MPTHRALEIAVLASALVVPAHGQQAHIPAKMTATLNMLTQTGNKHGANWATMGGAFQVDNQIAGLLHLGKATGGERMRNICEIGFNAGHSAAALMFHNNATLQEFDMQQLPYSEQCVAAVRAAHPGRLELHAGDSTKTVTHFLRKRKKAGLEVEVCDRFFIDGGHNNPVVEVDLANAMMLTRSGGMVMADDATSRFPDVPKEWKKLIASGHVADSKCEAYNMPPPAGLKGFCTGRRTSKPWTGGTPGQN